MAQRNECGLQSPERLKPNLHLPFSGHITSFVIWHKKIFLKYSRCTILHKLQVYNIEIRNF